MEPSKILVIGDSVSEGMGSVTNINTRWGNQLSDQYRARTALPDFNVGFLPVGVRWPNDFRFTIMDNSVSLPDAWGVSGVPGSKTLTGGQQTGFVTGVAADVVWLVDHDSDGRIVVQTDAAGEVAQPAATGLQTYTGVSGGGWTGIKVTAGTVRVLGCIFTRRGDTGPVVHTLAWSSTTTADWVQALTKTPVRQVIPRLAPELVMVQLGGNDMFANPGAVTVGQMQANLQSIRDTLTGLVPAALLVGLVTPVTDRVEATNPGGRVAIRDALDAVFGWGHTLDTSGVPDADAQPTWWHSDKIHLGDRAAAEIAAAVLQQMTDMPDEESRWVKAGSLPLPGSVDRITDATPVGRQLLRVQDGAAARQLIGSPTPVLTLGVSDPVPAGTPTGTIIVRV